MVYSFTGLVCLSYNFNVASMRQGIAVPKYTAQTAINAVFLCVKSQLNIIMSGWAGSRKAGRVVCPVLQPVQSGAMIAVVSSGLNTYTRTMNMDTQIQGVLAPASCLTDSINMGSLNHGK